MIAEQYREACLTPSDIYEHLPTFVDLAVTMDAQQVVELGTRGGVSTIAWLYAMEQTGGTLTSVDIDPAPELTHPQWKFIQGDDCDPDLVDDLPEADIVFIDTSHAYQHTVSELNIYRWVVRPGGRIVLHDTELAQPFGLEGERPFPVRRAVEEFLAETGWPCTWYRNCWGLAVIEVPDVH